MTITLKNIPPRLHRELKRRAEVNRRSLNSEIISSLEKVTFSQPVNVDALLADIRKDRERIGGYMTAEEIDRFKKEGRA